MTLDNNDKWDLIHNRNIYDRYYQDNSSQLYEPFLEVIVHLINQYDIKSLADYGSGSGMLGSFIQKHLPGKLTVLDAYDISPASITLCRPFYTSSYLSPGNKINSKQKYDLIVLNSLIEHLNDHNLKTLIDSIRQHLTVNGMIFFVTPNIYSPNYLMFVDKQKDLTTLGHVNLKSYLAWIRFFKSFGFSQFQSSFSLKLHHVSQISYFSSHPYLNKFIQKVYPLTLLSPFSYLRDSLYVLVK